MAEAKIEFFLRSFEKWARPVNNSDDDDDGSQHEAFNLITFF